MKPSSLFQERFSELIKGESYRTVAEKLGISKATVGAYATGSRTPKRPVLLTIARTYNINPAWLLEENSPKYVSKPLALENLLSSQEQSNQAPDFNCSTANLHNEGSSSDDTPSKIECDFTIHCEDDSMINARIFPGDIVYIRKQSKIESGDIAAVYVNHSVAIKRFYQFDDHIVLEAENPMYRPWTFWDEDMEKVKIIGKAIAFTSMNLTTK